MQTKHPGEARVSSIIWAYFRLMLAHVKPIWSHKSGKVEEAENTVKHTILHGRSRGRRQGRDSTLSFGEERWPTARTRPRWGPLHPWPDLRAAAPAAESGEKSFDGDQ